jgi:hypothetical protein
LILSQKDLNIWVKNFINSNGCGCTKCYQNKLLSDYHVVRYFQEEFRDLSDSSRENLLIFFVHQAVVNSDNWPLLSDDGIPPKRLQMTYRIEPFGLVCRGVFRKLLSLSDKKLRNLSDYVKLNKFPAERHHSSIGEAHNTLGTDVTTEIENWVIKLSKCVGEPKWKNITSQRDLEYIMLPACYSVSLLTAMCRHDLENRAFSRSAFYAVLRSDVCKHIKIRSSRTDMCSTCERIKVELRSLYQKRTMGLIDDIPELVPDEFNQHISAARAARIDYRTDQQRARDGLISHFSFDFAQNLTLPQCADQPGDLYFRSLRNVYLFGIVDESKNRQTNYLIDEGEMAKGANEVVSMLWYYLQNHCKTIKPKLVLNADNTVGQNKNNTLMRFLAWLCVTNVASEIEIKFMVVGHTHFLVDANFGHIKRKYHRSNAYIIEHLANIVTASSKSNEAVVLSHNEIFNFTSALSQSFVVIPKISSKHYFKFTSNKPWIAQVKASIDADWEEISLIKKDTPKNKIIAEMKSLECLPPIGISSEKKVDFYDKVRAFVPEEFKDILCPKPSETERSEVKITRAKRRKTKQDKV